MQFNIYIINIYPKIIPLIPDAFPRHSVLPPIFLPLPLPPLRLSGSRNTLSSLIFSNSEAISARIALRIDEITSRKN